MSVWSAQTIASEQLGDRGPGQAGRCAAAVTDDRRTTAVQMVAFAGNAGPPSSQSAASVNANLVSRHEQCPGPAAAAAAGSAGSAGSAAARLPLHILSTCRALLARCLPLVDTGLQATPITCAALLQSPLSPWDHTHNPPSNSGPPHQTVFDGLLDGSTLNRDKELYLSKARLSDPSRPATLSLYIIPAHLSRLNLGSTLDYKDRCRDVGAYRERDSASLPQLPPEQHLQTSRLAPSLHRPSALTSDATTWDDDAIYPSKGQGVSPTRFDVESQTVRGGFSTPPTSSMTLFFAHANSRSPTDDAPHARHLYNHSQSSSGPIITSYHKPYSSALESLFKDLEKHLEPNRHSRTKEPQRPS
ncbi:hypothetical protein F5882DRAFT_456760 [Hyaloscypha sp. PMI_1271]|nr:hypothetical protein F5882DRAFT_456760 [Hyaloscypha sp. PMI_1271]